MNLIDRVARDNKTIKIGNALIYPEMHIENPLVIASYQGYSEISKELDKLAESTRKLLIFSDDLDQAGNELFMQEGKIKELQAENKKLREALEFYANATNNPKQYMRQGYLVWNLKKEIFVDGGNKAREALKETRITTN